MACYAGKNIVIIGLGSTGLSCVDFFMRQGVVPRVIDTRSQPSGQHSLPAGVALHTGSLHRDWLLAADLIVASPGIALAHPELQDAMRKGIEVVGDIELFCREADAPIVAITGSNGKSTVTSLVGEMARCAGLRVGVGGNIGIPALSLLSDDYDLYVLELSSFQLETTFSLHAHAATVLNVTEDHMDRYNGMDDYRAAKLRVYQGAKTCVVNAEDALTQPVSSCERVVSFAPSQADYCLDTHLGEPWLMADGCPVLPVARMKLVGRHNQANALAALALADAAGIDRDGSLLALESFTGLAHRFELAHEANGVRWINDSKATNVGSTEAALQGLQVAGRLFLLLGGDGKGADFSSLQPLLQDAHIHLYCFGRDGAQLATLKADAVLTDTMEQALRLIQPQVMSGDMVLLSPACASLDQFKNFEVRGHEFTRLARELAG